MFARLREDIHSIFERDPAARSVWEVLTCYPGLHALLFHRWLSAPCWRLGLHWLARWISTIARWLTGIEIHPGATLGRRVFIDHGMGVVIGETAEVGDDCTLYHGVTLGGTSLQQEKRHPTLERGVVVGAGAKILGPITIGEGAKIGSNAVVVKAVPAGATAVGIPARVLLREEDAPDGPVIQPQISLVSQKITSDAAPDLVTEKWQPPTAEAAAISPAALEVSEKKGFSAYAVGREMNDPVLLVLHQLLEHVAKTEDRIDIMVKRLEAQGVDCSELRSNNPPLDSASLNKMLE